MTDSLQPIMAIRSASHILEFVARVPTIRSEYAGRREFMLSILRMILVHPVVAAFTVFLMLTGSPAAQATQPDDDMGYTNPLKDLRFDIRDGHYEFERASFEALRVYDPMERWNRAAYHFNHRLDQWVLLPTVRGYHFVTPRLVRSGVSNFFSNLSNVPSLINNLLQLKGKRSLQVSARLVVNTTIGIVGLWDPASRIGLHDHKEDFGQTLGHYSVPPGPYMVLPVLGPSNLRDTIGMATDFVADREINFLNMPYESQRHPEITILRGIDKRDSTPFRYGQLDSPFEYEQVRYIYTKLREIQTAD